MNNDMKMNEIIAKNDTTIYKIIRKMNDEIPNDRLFCFFNEKINYTYKEFNDEVIKCAKGLIKMGVKKNDHIGIWMDSYSKWYIIFFAANMIGAKVVPINTHFNKIELDNVLNSFDINYLFAANGYNDKYVKIIDSIDDNYAKLKKIITVNYESDRHINYDNMVRSGSDIFDEVAISYLNNTYADDICIILPTSGTTGFPKGVLLTNKQLMKNGFDIGKRYELSNQDNMLIQVPMFHCFGITLSMLASLTHLAKMTIISYFNPEIALNAIEKEKVTCINGVPTMYYRIMENPNFNKTNISTLTKGIMAGSNCLPEFIDEVTKKMNMDIISVYGLSEASPGCTMSSIKDSYEKRRNTVGKSLPDIECKIIDTKTKQEVNEGEIGEFVAKGYNIMKGYYNNEVETSNAIDAEGWLHSGDLVKKTEDGYYVVTGRIKDMIIRGGENIYPKEVEMVLLKIAGVKDATVYGVYDDKYGQEIVASIIIDDSINEEIIRNYMINNCARYKIPKYIDVTDSFITNPAGKVLKDKMSENFAKKLKNK